MSFFAKVSLLFCACYVGEAFGATRYAKVGGTGTTCGSWATACNLTTAISLADATTGDQVWVLAGTYEPITLKNGVKIIGGFSSAATSVTQSYPAVNPTIIDGGLSAPCATNVNTAPSALPAYLRGFTLRNGRDGGTDEGGALYFEQSNAQVVNCIIEDNSAAHMGGAVSMRGTGSPQFVNCIFRRNGQSASTNPGDTKGGGAIFLRDGTPQFVNCLFDNNQAGEGGAIIVAEGFPTFINCTFVNNKTTVGRGGAIYDPDGRVTLKNCILWSNQRVLQGQSSADQILSGSGGTTLASYSNVEGGWIGSGNINADPLFSSQVSYYLTASSPCKNTGDPSTTTPVAPDTVDIDWDANFNEQIPVDLMPSTRIRLGRVDMGAYELYSDTPPPKGVEGQ